MEELARVGGHISALKDARATVVEEPVVHALHPCKARIIVAQLERRQRAATARELCQRVDWQLALEVVAAQIEHGKPLKASQMSVEQVALKVV